MRIFEKDGKINFVDGFEFKVGDKLVIDSI
jgi:hypothetical protein